LIGIGAGSLVYHAWLEDRPLARAPGLVVLVLVASILIGEALIAELTYIVALALPLRASHAFNAVLSLGASATLELVPAIGMGLLFPLLVHFRGGAALDAGKTVGAIYAWNTLGTLVGATATALVLIPTWGSATSVAIALGLYAAAAVLLSPSRDGRD